jgi:hypothetical protein
VEYLARPRIRERTSSPILNSPSAKKECIWSCFGKCSF